MSHRRLFAITFFVALSAMLIWLYVNRPKQPMGGPTLVNVADQVFVTTQLRQADVAVLKQSGVKTIIAIRPDGEADDQTPSAEIKQAAEENQIKFHYIPVPHENIPDARVDALSAALATAEKPSALYCRTGRRAVRLFALAESSRADGPALDGILRMVERAGFSADDLREKMQERIANRASAKTPNP